MLNFFYQDTGFLVNYLCYFYNANAANKPSSLSINFSFIIYQQPEIEI